ncbi:hypothetical protein CLV44_1041 [Marinobacterium halophilum]|uniref:Uncharacterized protein n=1 Tax=Marinobacterium halophilum TaxID=267374 RepID=A0A2P8F0Z6_9GAMM|nr:hypothetical protein [Marinobacterium halophilum]PSL15393.1 hypothetical protein CLV44_1041 [Marinobacterium halophilum]
MIKTRMLGFISVLIAIVALAGCASNSKQLVERPDINKPLNENESIIILKRPSKFSLSIINFIVRTESQVIGDLSDGGELIWKTKAENFECIKIENLQLKQVLNLGFYKEDVPAPYKCFFTNPKEILSLNYDFTYPKSRIFRPVAFLPLYKKSPTFDKRSSVAINVNNSIATEAPISLKETLEKYLEEQFGSIVDNSSNKVIDIEILDFKSGNAVQRWFAATKDGSTLAKVKVTISENDKILDEFITAPVISTGGLATVGGDSLIFEEIAEDVYLHTFGLN